MWDDVGPMPRYISSRNRLWLSSGGSVKSLCFFVVPGYMLWPRLLTARIRRYGVLKQSGACQLLYFNQFPPIYQPSVEVNSQGCAHEFPAKI